MQSNCVQQLQEYNKALEDGSLGMNVSPPQCNDDGQYEVIMKHILQLIDKAPAVPVVIIVSDSP